MRMACGSDLDLVVGGLGILLAVELAGDRTREVDLDPRHAAKACGRGDRTAALMAQMAAPGGDEGAHVVGRAGEDLARSSRPSALWSSASKRNSPGIERGVGGEQIVDRSFVERAVGAYGDRARRDGAPGSRHS